jgi:uncharacterized membrane protein YqaE (UPF0057 family)
MVFMGRVILAILIPPLAVYLRAGAERAFWLNVLLTFLFYVPGLLHALRVSQRK